MLAHMIGRPLWLGALVAIMPVWAHDPIDLLPVPNEESILVGAASPPPTPIIIQHYEAGLSDQSAVIDAIGPIQYAVDCGLEGERPRTVVAQLHDTLPTGLFNLKPITERILSNAAERAWQVCLLPADNAEAATPEEYQVDKVELRRVDGKLLISARLMLVETSVDGQPTLHWSEWFEELGVPIVSPEVAATAAPDESNETIEFVETEEVPPQTPSPAFHQSIKFPITMILLLCGCVVWMWYNFTRHHTYSAHPAEHLVDGAIEHGRAIDGALFVHVHQPGVSSEHEMKVRTDQARDLTGRLRRHEAVLRSAYREDIEARRQTVERENAFLRAHEELLRAGIGHEMAAAALHELKRRS
jgi:hypothetical protein